MNRTRVLWLIWLLIAVPASVAILITMVYGGNRSVLLIGEATDGHYQIELACDACHTELFGGPEVLQDACTGCHGAELKQANDSHPRAKFTDPRNADRTARLDARYCVTCHREHKPEITQAMGVTLPDDYCFVCHEDIAEDRPSHKDLAFDSCATAGCHNFHDNRALYEDFLYKHQDAPAHLPVQRAAFFDWQPPPPKKPKQALLVADAAAPENHLADPDLLRAWAGDAHAAAGVNCAECHTSKTAPDDWLEKPDEAICARCHEGERETFGQGKHGLRLGNDLMVAHDGPFGLVSAEALSPMRPALARLPMKTDVLNKELSCNSCHGAHDFDTERAKAEACLGCHDDRHSQAYPSSPHGRLWQAEQESRAPAGSGVSCASCHMPRLAMESAYGDVGVLVTHNQNLTLQPNEKMIRPVCLACHGLGFAIDALADRTLIETNFSGQPDAHVPSLDWVVRRIDMRAAKTAGNQGEEDADGGTPR